mgnify:CR=1 FL=1
MTGEQQEMLHFRGVVAVVAVACLFLGGIIGTCSLRVEAIRGERGYVDCYVSEARVNSCNGAACLTAERACSELAK